MGLFDVTLFFVVAGSNLQWVATAAAAGPSSIVIWIIGCAAMFVPLSIVVVFLSSHYPDEGGMYVWAKRAFGPFAGFFTGWTYWTSNLPYFPSLLYFAAGNVLFVTGGKSALEGSAPFFIAVAVGGLALATVLNVLGLGVGKWLNNVGAAGRWFSTLALIVVGCIVVWRFGSATHVTAVTIRPGTHLKDVIFWSVIAFAWTGPEAISFMAGEIKNPRRNVPFGLLFAAPCIAVIYILGTVAVMGVVPSANVDASSGVMQAIGAASARLGWALLTPVAAVMVFISCMGSCGAWLGAVARIPFVAGIDRYLPPIFGRMHPRWGSPVAAIVTQAAVATVFIFLGQAGSSVAGAYQTLVNSTVLITMLPFMVLFASAMKLDAQPATSDPIRIPGGAITVRVAAAVGLLTTIAAAVLAMFPEDNEPNKPLFVIRVIAMTAVLVGAGVLVYRSGRRRAGAAPGLT